MTNGDFLSTLRNKNLLSIFLLGSEVRQFVHSGLFSELINSGWTITVVAKVVDEDIKSQLPDSVKLIPLYQNPHSLVSSETSRILDKAFNLRQTRHGKSSWQYGSVDSKNWRQSLLFSFEKYIARLVSYSTFVMSLFTRSEKRLFNKLDHSIWREYFTSNPTDAILVNVPRSGYWDPVLVTAEEMGIKRFLIYHTSKDITANGRLNHSFTRVGVWNSTMKKQLIENNPWVDPASVHVVGCGHFDCVGRKDWLPPENEFREQINALQNSLLLLYPTAGPGIVPEEERYIALVDNAVKQAEIELNKKIQIVFRMNPMDDREILYNHLKRIYPQHIVLRPDWRYIRRQNWCYARKSDPILYNGLLQYASLCVTIPSTVTVDCAFADLPVINLGIEVIGEQPLAGSLHSFWEVEFNRNIRETYAARFITTENELQESIIEFLKDKTTDQEKRRDLLTREVNGILPGKSTIHSLDLISSVFTENL